MDVLFLAVDPALLARTGARNSSINHLVELRRPVTYAGQRMADLMRLIRTNSA